MPSKQKAAPRQRMKAAEREQVILAEAIRFFAEHGFEGQTRELAKRVGIAHSALYRHFPSKEALIERVYEHVFLSRWNPDWEIWLADSSQSLEERLIRFYLAYVERIFHYDWVRIFVFSGLRSYNITGRYLSIIREKLILPVAREVNGPGGKGSDVSQVEEEAVWALHGQIFYIAIRKYVYGTPVPTNLEPIIVDHVRRFVRGSVRQSI